MFVLHGVAILLDFLQGISVRVFSWERDFTVGRFQSSGVINISLSVLLRRGQIGGTGGMMLCGLMRR